ncbi:MAG: response regulator [Devosia sp.]
MSIFSSRQPAIALVDDDYHSARLLTRMLEAHGAPQVARVDDTDEAVDALADAYHLNPGMPPFMAVVDLKSSSNATRDFVLRLKTRAPHLLVVAMAPSLDRETRNALIDAGASAVFERHADIGAYRSEAASIVAFWVRNQHLDGVGT